MLSFNTWKIGNDNGLLSWWQRGDLYICFCFLIPVVKREICDVVTKGTLTKGEMLIQMKNLSTSPRNCFTLLGTHMKTRLLVLQQTLYTCIMHKSRLERKIYS